MNRNLIKLTLVFNTFT